MNYKLYLLAPLLFAAAKTYAQTVEIDTMYVELPTQRAELTTPTSHLNISTTALKIRNTGQEPSFILSQLSPSITVHSDAGSGQGYSYMRLRGIDQTRINFSLDGIPLNEPEDQGAYFSNYPDLFNSLKYVQIQRGVGTSQNGSASYAGSVQLYQRVLTDSMETEIGAGYGSFNSYRAYAKFSSGLLANNKLLINARLSYLHSDGYRDHSGNTSESGFINLVYFPTTKHVFRFTNILGRQRNGQAWLASSAQELAANPRHNGNSAQERDNFVQNIAGLHHLWTLRPHIYLESQIYYTHLRGNYDFDLNNFLGLPTTPELYNYNFVSDWVGGHTNLRIENERLLWTTGVHFYSYQRQHLGSEKALGELYRNTGYKKEISGFTRVEYQLIKGLSLYTEWQLRYAAFSYKGSAAFLPVNWLFSNPKAGVSYQLPNALQFYATVGRTSREPTRNDMFLGNDDLALDSLSLPVLGNLHAESVLDFEAGARYNKGNFALQANGFFMSFQNEIVLNGGIGPNALVLTSNVERSFRTGVELSADIKINNWLSLQNASAFTFSQIHDQNIDFSPILTPKAVLNQSLTLTRWGGYLLISARYQSGAYLDLANTARIDGYFLLSAQAGYSYRGWRLSLFGNNLLNAKYYNNAYVGSDGATRFFATAPINGYLMLSKTF